MDRETIDKLAGLARIDISEKETENLAGELETILKYVGEIKGVTNNQQPTASNKEDFSNRNIMREDDEVHESGIYTEDLLGATSDKEGDYVKVKKIL